MFSVSIFQKNDPKLNMPPREKLKLDQLLGKYFTLKISMASFLPFVLITSQNKSYVAVRLKDQDLRDSRQEAAKAFIQNCLYGPGTNRTTGNFLTDCFFFLF